MTAESPDSTSPSTAPPRRSYRLLAGIIALGLATGLLGGLAAGRLAAGDRITVGNTAGTLSTVIRIDGRLVVVGGGDDRGDLRDLVGRATLPWSRQVDVLVVPGWDSEQAVGALGLIEGGSVRALSILGTTGDHPSWALLEQAAVQRDIAVTHLNGEQRLDLADGVSLQFQPPPSTDVRAALVRLNYHGNEITLADIAGGPSDAALSSWDVLPARTNLLIAARPVDPGLIGAAVVLQPAARQQSELPPLAPGYVGELRPGERMSIRLSGGRLRLPANRLRPTFVPPTP
ncbi:MAG TPA: hypothetical protein VFI42_05280 [Thermomicrobiaceae bacterium]|nr:hypothetical protein [Thermomicrobiaceae bacterium]